MKGSNGTGAVDRITPIVQQCNLFFDALEDRQEGPVVHRQHRQLAVCRLQGFQVGVAHIPLYSKPDLGLRKLGKEKSAGLLSWIVDRFSFPADAC